MEKKAKFKVGQKVKVRKDINAVDVIDGVTVVPKMLKYRDKDVTIAYVFDRKTRFDYAIREDGCMFNWSENMFVDTKKEKKERKVFKLESCAGIEIFLEKVIINDPAVVLFYRLPVYMEGKFYGWGEAKKVVAKCNKELDEFNEYKGIEVAKLKAFKKEIENKLKKM